MDAFFTASVCCRRYISFGLTHCFGQPHTVPVAREQCTSARALFRIAVSCAPRIRSGMLSRSVLDSFAIRSLLSGSLMVMCPAASRALSMSYSSWNEWCGSSLNSRLFALSSLRSSSQ